jgi:hypothetical protein
VIKIIKFSFKAFSLSCAAAIVLVCVLSFSNIDFYVAKNHIYLAEHHMIQNLEEDMLTGLSYAAAEPIADFKNRLENGESAYDTTKMQSRETVLYILNDELERHFFTVNRLTKENPVMGFNLSRYIAEKALNEATIMFH